MPDSHSQSVSHYSQKCIYASILLGIQEQLIVFIQLYWCDVTIFLEVVGHHILASLIWGNGCIFYNWCDVCWYFVREKSIVKLWSFPTKKRVLNEIVGVFQSDQFRAEKQLEKTFYYLKIAFGRFVCIQPSSILFLYHRYMLNVNFRSRLAEIERRTYSHDEVTAWERLKDFWKILMP